MKKKNLFSILFLILFLGNVQALENKIILKIDNEIITSIDLLNEIKYISTLNPSIKNLDKNRLKLIGKKSLIKEIIKKNEILKYIDETKIDQKYLKRLIKDRYLKLNFSTEADFLLYLKSNQVDIREIENKLTIEALWNQLIYSKFSSKLKINKKNLEEIIKNENKKTSKSFLLSEIFFNIKSKDELDSKYNEIKKAIENNSFESAAATYSVSDSSNVGGKLGWINEKSLSQNIKINLKKN
jgi:peptidyl-prolyl cis-trans isomerase SurA